MITETVKAICERELDRIAQEIEGEMKAVCNDHRKNGDAYNAIHIESPTPMTRFIGGTSLSLYYLDQGNGGRDAIIRPKRKKALLIEGAGHTTIGHAKYVHGYDGIHFIKEIADRYR